MADSLPRRAFLGVHLASGSLRVTRVLPGSMAAAAGVEPGDELVALAGEALGDLGRALRRCGGLERAELRVTRGGAEIAAEVAVREAPREPGAAYDQVLAGGARLRLITTAPAGEPRGLVLFLQGIALDSIELPGSPFVAASIDGWSRRGFATARLERRGTGDSEGAAPDFETEVADAGAALASLAARFERVVLFGHSLGGMVAPLIAGPASAVVVYGSSARRWYACVDDGARRQLADRGAPAAEIEAHVARSREARARGESDDERSAAFHAQLDATDLAAAWRAVSCPVLSLWGDRDRVVGRDEARMIAQLAPAGDFAAIAGVDHGGAPEPARVVDAAAVRVLALQPWR